MIDRKLDQREKEEKKVLPPGEDSKQERHKKSGTSARGLSEIQIMLKRRVVDQQCIKELLDIIDRQEQIMINLCKGKRDEMNMEQIRELHQAEIVKIDQKVEKARKSLDMEDSLNLATSIKSIKNLRLERAFRSSQHEEEKQHSLESMFEKKRPKYFRENSTINKLAGDIELSQCKCKFPREKMKCYIIEKSKGRIYFPYNDQKFQLIKCPSHKCRVFVSLYDIKELFEEEQLIEVDEYNLQYTRKSYPEAPIPECVICQSQALSQYGCPRHPMCKECEEQNRIFLDQCPALGCEWMRKD